MPVKGAVHRIKNRHSRLIKLRKGKAAVRTGGSQDYVLSLVRWGESQFAVSNIALWVEG